MSKPRVVVGQQDDVVIVPPAGTSSTRAGSSSVRAGKSGACNTPSGAPAGAVVTEASPSSSGSSPEFVAMYQDGYIVGSVV